MEANLSEQETSVNITLEDNKFVSNSNIKDAISIVNNLDFTLQTKKMVDYNGLDQFYVTKCMSMYKNFLSLKIAYHDINLVPNSMIDEAWHQHILDTKKYSEDCQLLFGKFLHHYPYFGLRGDEDVKNWKEVSRQTAIMYEHHFGSKLYEGDTARGCSSQGCW